MKNKKFSFRLEQELYLLLEKECDEVESDSVSLLIRSILKDHYRNKHIAQGKQIIPEYLQPIDFTFAKRNKERELKKLKETENILKNEDKKSLY